MSDDLLDLAHAKRFAGLTARKRELEAQIREIESELAVEEDHIREGFARHGLKTINLPDFTIYLAKEVRARPTNGDDELACSILKAHGHEWLVKETINRNTLSSWVREWLGDPEGHEISPAIRQALEITNVYRVRARAK